MFSEESMASISKTSEYAFSPAIKHLAELIQRSGCEAYVVGGAVRDMLLGLNPGDVDIVVDSHPMEIAEQLSRYLSAKYFKLHDHHSTVRVLFQSEEFNQCAVDISAMKVSIMHDLTHRDFTCNALALPIELASSSWGVAQIIDGAAGITAISQRTLTAVSGQSFNQDPLRLLRAFRLAAELDLDISEKTLAMVKRDAPLISEAAPERIRDELLRIVGTSRSFEFLELMLASGILDYFLPELTEGRGVQQPPEHQSDVLMHNLRTPAMLHRLVFSSNNPYKFAIHSPAYSEWHSKLVSEDFSDGYPRWNFLALAGLFHDVGKPTTKTIEDGGRIRFLNHGLVGSEIVKSLLFRLRFSSKAVNYVARAVGTHMRPSQIYAPGSLPTPKAMYRYHRDLNGISEDVLFLSLADYLAAVQDTLDLRDWEYKCTITEQVLNWHRQESIAKKARYLDGHDIMHEFLLTESPIIGYLLALLDEAVALGTVRSREQALLYLGEVQVKL